MSCQTSKSPASIVYLNTKGMSSRHFEIGMMSIQNLKNLTQLIVYNWLSSNCFSIYIRTYTYTFSWKMNKNKNWQNKKKETKCIKLAATLFRVHYDRCQTIKNNLVPIFGIYREWHKKKKKKTLNRTDKISYHSVSIKCTLRSPQCICAWEAPWTSPNDLMYAGSGARGLACETCPHTHNTMGRKSICRPTSYS